MEKYKRKNKKKKTHFKMNELTDNLDLNINSWLINWGYLNGYLQERNIKTTKFGILNEWSCFLWISLTGIKWLILLLYPKETEIVNQLGDWGYFIGPKVFLDLIIIIGTSHLLIIKLLFKLSLKNAKLFYWLEMMDSDNETESFHRANLNESDSKLFIKRISLLMFIVNWFTYSFMLLFVFVNCFSLLKYRNDYHLHYLI